MSVTVHERKPRPMVMRNMRQDTFFRASGGRTDHYRLLLPLWFADLASCRATLAASKAHAIWQEDAIARAGRMGLSRAEISEMFAQYRRTWVRIEEHRVGFRAQLQRTREDRQKMLPLP